MKFNKIKTLKILKFNILCYVMLMVSSKNLLHIDTPEHGAFSDFSDRFSNPNITAFSISEKIKNSFPSEPLPYFPSLKVTIIQN